jgi:phosphoglycolate phosphatase
MPLKNVIFDLDGTLVDSLPGIEYSVDCALRDRSYPARTCEVRPLIGPPIRHTLQMISGEIIPEALDGLESAFRSAYDTEGWKKTVLQTEAKETLNWLASSGRRLYIVTNKPQQATRRIVEHFGLFDFFSTVLSPDCNVPRYRSKVEMIRRLMLADSVSATNSLFVGDTREDMDAAAAVGMPSVILTTGYGGICSKPSQAGFQAIQTLGELKSLMQVSFGGS